MCGLVPSNALKNTCIVKGSRIQIQAHARHCNIIIPSSRLCSLEPTDDCSSSSSIHSKHKSLTAKSAVILSLPPIHPFHHSLPKQLSSQSYELHNKQGGSLIERQGDIWKQEGRPTGIPAEKEACQQTGRRKVCRQRGEHCMQGFCQ